MKLLMFFIIALATGQRSSYIQSIVNQIKSFPRHKSVSPSFNGERKYEVIGTGKLPLQSDVGISESESVLRNLNNMNKSPRINKALTGRISRLDTFSDDTTNSDTEVYKKDSSVFFLDKTSMLTQSTNTNIATEQHSDEEQLLSQGSHSISRSSVRRKFHDKQRHRNPNNAFRVRPNIGNLMSKFFTKDKRPRRKQNYQKKRPQSNHDHYDENGEIGQVEVEDFSAFEDNKQHQVPGRKIPRTRGEQMYKRSKRKQGSSPLKVNNPFKNLQVRSPLKHRKRNKNVRFRPPAKTFNGFEPYFKGSLSYDEAEREQERVQHNPVIATQDYEEIQPIGSSQGKRPTRFGPGRPRQQRPISLEGANSYPHAEEGPAFGHPQGNSNPFDHGNPSRPLLYGPPQGKIPERFTADQPRRQRPSHQAPSDILPFSEEIPSFGPEQDRPIGFRPDRPKRQRPHLINDEKEQDIFGLNLRGNSFQAPIFKDAPNDNMGFFSDVQENFPDIEAFGIGWDSQKVRRKREALGNPIYYAPQRRRPRRGQRPRQTTRQASRRQGPGGFWDDEDFDAEFFNGGSPQAFNPFNAFPQQEENIFKKQFSTPIERPRGLRTVRKPNAKPKITPKKYNSDRYTTSTGNSFQSIEDNSILGSGNFEILKGGTFYDEDDYRRPYSNNRPAQPYKYYGNNDIFHNFRDFADIKDDNRQKGYQEGFYYR